MSNAIATLSMQLGLDTREFTKGVTATSKEIRTVKQIMTDTQTPLERLQAQLAGIESLRQKFGTVPEERWARAIRNVQDEYRKAEEAAKDAALARVDVVAEPTGGLGDQMAGLMPPKLGAITGAVGPLGAAFGVAAVAIAGGTAALAGFVKTTELVISTALDGINRLDEMADSAKALGMEASAFQQLQIAATLADAPAEELFKVIGKMEQILGDPPEEAVKAFDKLGLRISTLRDMGPAAFGLIAAKLDELPTRAEKFAVMGDIFGRVDKRMINLIDDFDGFMAQAEGFSLDESQFGAIDTADNAFKELNASITHIKDTLAVEFAPALAELVQTFGDFLNQDSTQSAIMTGIVIMRDTLQEVADIAETIGEYFSMDSVLDAISALGPKAALAVEGLRSLTEPFKEIAEAEKLGRESVKAARKEAEEAKKSADLAKGESNAKDKAAEKAAKDAEKRDAERFQKFSESLDKLHAEAMAIGGDPMEKMRLEAEAAGANGEADIAAYIEAKKEIDRLKESEADLKAVQADRAKQAEKDAADFAKFMEESLSPQEKAMEKMRRAMELGIPEVALDKLAGDLASGLTKGIANAPEAVALQKGSREAASFLAKSSKEERQLKATEQMRDYLKTIAAKDTSVVVEEVGIP